MPPVALHRQRPARPHTTSRLPVSMARHLLTAALPYANGSIHIGHVVEYVLADIRARFLRLMGEDVLFVCADDTHGTPIEMNARKQGITPEELVGRSWHEHVADMNTFEVSFDEFYTTNSPENQEFANTIYLALRDQGLTHKKVSRQFYSQSLGRFLPDRMVKGTCPVCGAADQYGDACEVCKSTYEPEQLINPVDAIEGGTPELRDTEQIYVRLPELREFLQDWVIRGIPQDSVRNFVQAWLDGGLNDWCISREAPYFGFEIPGEPGKYFYVWLDAPIGYMAATRHWCDRNGVDWRSYWGPDSDAVITHVIGKDIVYFHTLFWPAMLHTAGFRVPDEVRAHGFLTVDGAKMSKSRGTFIKASTAARHVDPEHLRFYFAGKISNGIEDLDLNFEDFVSRVNSDLVNNIVNLCSRVTKMIDKRFGGEVVAFDPHDFELCGQIDLGMSAARGMYQQWDFRGAVRRLAEVGDAVNLFLQESEPWRLVETDRARALTLLSVALHGATAIMTALSPVTPRIARTYAACIGVEKLEWTHTSPRFVPTRVQAPDVFISRIDPDSIKAMIEETRAENTPPTPARMDIVEVQEFKPVIEFDDFARVDLRVGVVLSAEAVEGADKLLKLQVHCGKSITVFAGIRKAYPDPSVLVGRHVLVVANLKPRKMKFGTSEGMLLATSAEDDTGLQLAIVSDETRGGWTVR